MIKIWLGMLENMGIPVLGEEMTIKQEQVQYVAEVLLPLFARARAMLQGVAIKALQPSKMWSHCRHWEKIATTLKDSSGKSMSSDWKRVLNDIGNKGMSRIRESSVIQEGIMAQKMQASANQMSEDDQEMMEIETIRKEMGIKAFREMYRRQSKSKDAGDDAPDLQRELFPTREASETNAMDSGSKLGTLRGNENEQHHSENKMGESKSINNHRDVLNSSVGLGPNLNILGNANTMNQTLIEKMLLAMEQMTLANSNSAKKVSKALEDLAQKSKKSKKKSNAQACETPVIIMKSKRKKKAVNYAESNASKGNSIHTNESDGYDDDEEEESESEAESDEESEAETEDGSWNGDDEEASGESVKPKASSSSSTKVADDGETQLPQPKNRKKKPERKVTLTITATYPLKFSGDDGNNSDALEWLDSLENYFKLTKTKVNPAPGSMIRSLLVGKARNWWIANMQDVENLTWIDFKKEFRNNFLNIPSLSTKQQYWMCEKKHGESYKQFLERVYTLGRAAKIVLNDPEVVEQWGEKLPYHMRQSLLTSPPNDFKGLISRVRKMESNDGRDKEKNLYHDALMDKKKFKSLQMVCSPCQEYEEISSKRGEIFALSIKKKMPPCAHDNHEAGSCFKQLFCINCEDYGHLANSHRCKFCPICEKVSHRPDQPCASLEFLRSKRHEIPNDILDQSANNCFKKDPLNLKDQKN